MQQHPTPNNPSFDTAKSEIAGTVSREKQSATEALHDARDDVTRKASEYASEAKDALREQATQTQQDVSDRMTTFAGALKAASEHLADSDQKAVSNLMLEAAGGLESLSASLKDKPFEAVVQEVRAFGRDNPGALFAGAMIAGLALGRVAKSASGQPTRTDAPNDQNAGGM